MKIEITDEAVKKMKACFERNSDHPTLCLVLMRVLRAERYFEDGRVEKLGPHIGVGFDEINDDDFSFEFLDTGRRVLLRGFQPIGDVAMVSLERGKFCVSFR